MEEHIGRYDDFATFLMTRGFVVTGHDHRGHGITTEKNGQYGYFADKLGFERVTEDVREVLLLFVKIWVIFRLFYSDIVWVRLLHVDICKSMAIL